MASAEDHGMVRQPSSSNCASSPFGDMPYLRVMKTQLNFFMTRLLFMQEERADSLGARATNARRHNTSLNNSANFNNSASRLDANRSKSSGVDDALLGYFDEEPRSDDICVYSDNARILPNSAAKSVPAVPFPPAAPESPRPVEGKKGVVLMTPTHQPAKLPPLPEHLPFCDMDLEEVEVEDQDKEPTRQPGELPPLPENLQFDDMDLEEEEVKDQDKEEEVKDQDEDEVEEAFDEDAFQALKEGEDEEEDEVEEVTMEAPPEEDSKPAARKNVSPVPPEQRVFPKNQRRSKRYSTGERGPVKRSQSLGRKGDEGTSDEEDQINTGINSNSLH